jgi:phospholipid-binding lipoprotein MlaA
MTVALDRYSFVRDAYLARRRDAVFDGAAPIEIFEDDADDPPAKPPLPPAAVGAPQVNRRRPLAR